MTSAWFSPATRCKGPVGNDALIGGGGNDTLTGGAATNNNRLLNGDIETHSTPSGNWSAYQTLNGWTAIPGGGNRTLEQP